MDRIITIGRCQWRAFWRRFRRAGHLNAGNQGILLIFSVLILARYLQSLRTAATDLPQGKTRVFESLLLAIFLVWMFPLASNARTSISTRKLLHLPLTLRGVIRNQTDYTFDTALFLGRLRWLASNLLSDHRCT